MRAIFLSSHGHTLPYHRRVSNEKRWNIEAVLMLGVGMLISLSVGTFAVLAFRQLGPETSDGQQKFISFLISGVSFQFAGLVLTHFFLKAHSVTWSEFLGLSDPRLKGAVLLALAVVLVALPLTLGLNELSRIVITQLLGQPEAQPTMQVLQMSQSFGQKIWFGFTAILMAPLVEEILFRGVIYRTGKQLGYPLLSLLLSSLVFAAIHGSLMTFVPLTIFAIILALLYDKTDNLLAPITTHSVFNATNFFLYIYREDLSRWWKEF